MNGSTTSIIHHIFYGNFNVGSSMDIDYHSVLRCLKGSVQSSERSPTLLFLCCRLEQQFNFSCTAFITSRPRPQTSYNFMGTQLYSSYITFSIYLSSTQVLQCSMVPRTEVGLKYSRRKILYVLFTRTPPSRLRVQVIPFLSGVNSCVES